MLQKLSLDMILCLLSEGPSVFYFLKKLGNNLLYLDHSLLISHGPFLDFVF